MITPALLDRLGHRIRLAVLAASLGLAACGGGGGGSAGVGSGGTGSYAVGPISGFGSVILNGIRYEDSRAEVFDLDGNARSVADLRLGMVIEVDGSALTLAPTGPTGDAETIRYASEIVGPVEQVDAAARTLLVLGQDVDVTASTVFDGALAGGLGALQPGQEVEVYGLVNASGNGRYTATRIELRSAPPESYRLRGPVRELAASARTFRIGNALISYAGLDDVPALADGQLVRVRLLPVPQAGIYEAEELRSAARRVDDCAEAEIEGLVSSVEAGDPRRFSLEGVPVDASTAEFDDGVPADLAIGVRVEVEGRIEGGVLIADKVEIEDADGGTGGAGREIELSGPVEALDTVGEHFVLRGLAVSYADAVFDDGNAGDLGNGVQVEVKGRLAADGVTVEAREIEIDDD